MYIILIIICPNIFIDKQFDNLFRLCIGSLDGQPSNFEAYWAPFSGSSRWIQAVKHPGPSLQQIRNLKKLLAFLEANFCSLVTSHKCSILKTSQAK